MQGDGVFERDGNEQADRFGGGHGKAQPLELHEMLPQAVGVGGRHGHVTEQFPVVLVIL